MLVLSRFKDEQIVIGGGITVTVVEIHGDRVRLGIDAPREVPVDRLEIHKAKQRDLSAAAGKSTVPNEIYPSGNL